MERVHLSTSVLAANGRISRVTRRIEPVRVKLFLASIESLLIIALNLHNLVQIVQLILTALSGEFFIAEHRYSQSADRLTRGRELEEVILDQGDVEQVRGVDEYTWLTDVNRSAVVLKESL